MVKYQENMFPAPVGTVRLPYYNGYNQFEVWPVSKSVSNKNKFIQRNLDHKHNLFSAQLLIPCLIIRTSRVLSTLDFV